MALIIFYFTFGKFNFYNNNIREKKLLDSDWLRAVQLKSNTSANYKSKFSNLIFSPQVSEIRLLLKKFINLRLHSKLRFRSFPSPSEHFRGFPTIFENFQKVSEDRFENFATFSAFSKDFLRLTTISED